MTSPTDERHSRLSSSPGIASLASTTRSRIASNISQTQHNTLPPMLGHAHSGNNLYLPQRGLIDTFSTVSSAPTSSPTKLTPGVDIKVPTATLEASIADLETQLIKLKKYEEEFIALNLDDSRRMLTTQVAELEGQIKARKREKSLMLIERLKKEGFGPLAAVVGKEVGLGVDP
jgi:hypothetical protein